MSCKKEIDYELPRLVMLILALCFFSCNTFADIVLKGKTHLPALANGAVTVHVGSDQYSSTTDLQGRFEVQLGTAQPDDLVRVHACGAADQAHVCHWRLVNSVATIESQLDQDDVFQTGPVSPVSTAALALLTRGPLAGSLPKKWSDIEIYRMSFDVLSLLRDAAVASLMADDASLLPNGYDDIASVLMNPPVALHSLVDRNQQLERFLNLADHDPVYLNPGMDYLVEELRISAMGQSVADLVVFVANNDGTGTFSSIKASDTIDWENVLLGDLIFSDTMVRFSVGNSYVRLLGEDGGAIGDPEIFYFYPPGEGEPVEGIKELKEVEVRLLNASEALSLGLVARNSLSSAPDRPDLDPDDFHFLGESVSHSTGIALVGDIASQSILMLEENAVWAFPVCEPDCEPHAISGGASLDLVSFQAGSTATTSIMNIGLSWQVNNGVVELTQDDGTVLKVFSWGLPGPHIDTRDSQWVTVEATRPDTQVRSSTFLIMEADPGAAFDANALIGRYVSTDQGVFVLEAGGTGWQAFLDDPEDSRPESGGFDLIWEISGAGDLVVQLGPRDLGVYPYYYVQRPVFIDASGHYVIERRDLSGTSPEAYGGFVIHYRRIN